MPTFLIIIIKPPMINLHGFEIISPLWGQVCHYSISNDAMVTLQIYNHLGIPIKTLVNENKSIGTYNINLDTSRMMSGTYCATIRVNEGNISVDKTIKIIINR
jgi:hypothetical protein